MLRICGNLGVTVVFKSRIGNLDQQQYILTADTAGGFVELYWRAVCGP
jgi:hypothetical protein